MSIRVWNIGDPGESYLVRGTEDVEEAREAVVDVVMGDPQVWIDTVDQAREVVARYKAEVGWYRCNPCYCGGQHQFDMDSANGPGRGNFRGVYLS